MTNENPVQKKPTKDSEKEFDGLVARVQKEGGFLYATVREKDEPYDNTMYNFGGTIKRRESLSGDPELVAVRGIHRKDERVLKDLSEEVACKSKYDLIDNFMDDVDRVDRTVHEVVLYGQLMPGNCLTHSLLYAHKQETVGLLTYCAKRVPTPEEEKEKQENPDKEELLVTINQTLVSSHNTIEALAEKIREDPNRASALFKGVFPRLEAKYSIQRNGRIVILERVHMGDLRDPDKLEREAIDYEVKSE